MDEASRSFFDLGSGPEAGPSTELARVLGAARMFSMAVQETIESTIQTDLSGDRLSKSQWKLLEIFALAEVTNVTEVAAYQGVSTAAASKAVDRLVRIGLLIREEDHEDRRHIRLSLSAEGRELVDAYLRRFHAKVSSVFRQSSLEKLSRLAHELEDLAVSAMRGSVSSIDRVCLQCGMNRREPCLFEERLGNPCHFHTVHKPAARYAEAHAANH